MISTFIFAYNLTFGQLSNLGETDFNSDIVGPTYQKGKGPKILSGGAHYNFFIQWNYIKPFYDLFTKDGFQIIVDSLKFKFEYLKRFDIVKIITALPFSFTTKNEITDESTFFIKEINIIYYSNGSISPKTKV